MTRRLFINFRYMLQKFNAILNFNLNWPKLSLPLCQTRRKPIPGGSVAASMLPHGLTQLCSNSFGPGSALCAGS